MKCRRHRPNAVPWAWIAIALACLAYNPFATMYVLFTMRSPLPFLLSLLSHTHTHTHLMPLGRAVFVAITVAVSLAGLFMRWRYSRRKRQHQQRRQPQTPANTASAAFGGFGVGGAGPSASQGSNGKATTGTESAAAATSTTPPGVAPWNTTSVPASAVDTCSICCGALPTLTADGKRRVDLGHPSVKQLGCGDAFHLSCITNWLQNQASSGTSTTAAGAGAGAGSASSASSPCSCPVCRQPATFATAVFDTVASFASQGAQMHLSLSS